MADQASRGRSAARRKQYIQLLELGSQIDAAIKTERPVPLLKRISDVAERSDKLISEKSIVDRTENSSEVVMDAQVVKLTHELVDSVAMTMDDTAISDDEFIVAINRTIGPNKDWHKLAEVAVKMAKTISYSQPLFGSFGEETVLTQKEVKPRRKNTTIKNTQQMRPIAVVQQKKKQEEQEAETVNVVGNRIIELYEETNEPLPYYKLIIDPENFMRTIHNAFQVSFLLRDGVIAIEEDEFGYPTVRPTNDDEKEGDKEPNRQMVSNLTTKLCEEMIERYRITEPMITWEDQS